MTTVSFRMDGARITAVAVSGHSGYGEAGGDIVCAAITSAVRLTECAINDVLGIGAAVKVKQADASLSLKLPGGLDAQNETVCQTLLTALMVYLTGLREEYPAHIMVSAEDSNAE